MSNIKLEGLADSFEPHEEVDHGLEILVSYLIGAASTHLTRQVTTRKTA